MKAPVVSALLGLLIVQPGLSQQSPGVEGRAKPGPAPCPAVEVEESCGAPAIVGLRRKLATSEEGALQEFWSRVRQVGTPLVEPSDVPGQSWVTFLWRGRPETRNVVLFGGPASPRPVEARFAPIDGTDIWCRSYLLPSNLRFTYELAENDSLDPFFGPDVEGRERFAAFGPDPWNPRLYLFLDSLVELPEAAAQPWIHPLPGTEAGEVEMFEIGSESVPSRPVWVYRPSRLEASPVPHPLLVLFDGSAMLWAIPASIILDNLIAHGEIPPLVALFVGSPNRDAELAASAPFAAFVARGLVPWAQKTFGAGGDRNRTIVGGQSRGGLASAFVALLYPGIFGGVLSQSGSFYWAPQSDTEPEWLSRQYASPRRRLRFFLEVGVLERRGGEPEGPSFLTANRHLRDVLRAAAHEVSYREFPGGHDYVSWRGGLAPALNTLLEPRETELSGRQAPEESPEALPVTTGAGRRSLIPELSRSAHFEGAAALLDRVRRLESPLEEAELTRLGYLLLAQGHSEAAISLLEFGAARPGAGANHHAELARAHLMTGQIEGAQKWGERALQLESENEMARRVLRLITDRRFRREFTR